MTVESLSSTLSWLPAHSLNKKPTLLIENQSDINIEQIFDKASGLVQTIVTHKLSNAALHKSPSDEYLSLLSLLNRDTLS